MNKIRSYLLVLTVLTLTGAKADITVSNIAQPPGVRLVSRGIIPIMRFRLTGENCSIAKLVLQKIGTTPDNDFGDVLLILEEDNSIRASGTFGADDKFSWTGPLWFTGEKVYDFTVAVRMSPNLQAYASNQIGISLVNIESSCGPVSGPIPVNGNVMSFDAAVQPGNVTFTGIATSNKPLIGVTNQVLGSFNAHVWQNEPMAIKTMLFHIPAPGNGGNGFGVSNIRLFDADNNVAAGPVDAYSDSEGWSGAFRFTNTVILPPGDSTYTIKGALDSSFNNNSLIQLTASPSTYGEWAVVGTQTGFLIELWPGQALDLGRLQVAGPMLVAWCDQSPLTVAPGAAQAEIFKVNLSASEYQSGESLLVQKIRVLFDSSASAYVGNIRLFDTDGTVLSSGTNIIDTPTNHFADIVLDSPYLLSKDEIVTHQFSVRASISSAAPLGTGFSVNIDQSCAGYFQVFGVLSGLRAEMNILITLGTGVYFAVPPAPHMSLLKANDSTVRIEVLGAVGEKYHVLSSTNLTVWADTGIMVTNNTGSATVSVPVNPSQPAGYFRLAR